MKKIFDIYYQTLDFSKISKEEYNKLVISLIYYCKIFQDEVPQDIDKFLYDCLDID